MISRIVKKIVDEFFHKYVGCDFLRTTRHSDLNDLLDDDEIELFVDACSEIEENKKQKRVLNLDFDYDKVDSRVKPCRNPDRIQSFI